MRLWEYVFLFVPVRYRDYYSQPGVQGGNFYLSPLIGVLALKGNPIDLCATLFFILLSTGGVIFKFFSKFMLRLPFYWGYFACICLIFTSLDVLGSLHLSNTKLTLLCLVLGVLLLFNSFNLPLYPENMWTKPPSKYFNSPLLKWLEKNSNGLRVNNMQYPYYHGQINHIKSMGYCGGNHTLDIHKIRGIPNVGCGGYNWFDYREDGEDLDKFGVGFHIGDKPSQEEKWTQSKMFKNLWINKKLYSISTETTAPAVKSSEKN